MVKLCSEEIIKALEVLKENFPKEVSLRKIASEAERDTEMY